LLKKTTPEGDERKLREIKFDVSQVTRLAIRRIRDDVGRHFGRRVAYVETDKAEADRETIVGNFLGGQYNRPLRVIAFKVDERWCREVSEDIAVEVLQRATATDHDLPEATMAFIERHTAFEKKPPAPSVARPQSTVDRRRA
jgi:hypothetical protein